MSIPTVGAACFGLVIGWISYRTLRRTGSSKISDIATIVAAVGGGAVTTIFNNETLFGIYSIGLAVGFFGYLIVSLLISGRSSAEGWMEERNDRTNEQ